MNTLVLGANNNESSGPLSTPAPPAHSWPHITTAVEILPPGSVHTDYDRWRATRTQGLGGSEVAAVLGMHPYLSAYDVWLSKVGRGRDKRDRWAMRRGRYFEPALAQWWSDQTGLSTRSTGTWSRCDAPWMMVNPDRLTSDGYGLELKMPASIWSAQWRAQEPPMYAVVQALWGCMVTGLPGWYLAADINQGHSADLPVWHLDAQEWAERTAYWADVADWWWHRYVVADRRPPVDGSEATAEALNWVYRAGIRLGHLVRVPGLRAKVDERARLKKVIKDAETRLTCVENWIKAGLEHDETGCDEDDVPIIAWSPRGTDPEDPSMPAMRAMRAITPPKPKTPRKKRITTP